MCSRWRNLRHSVLRDLWRNLDRAGQAVALTACSVQRLYGASYGAVYGTTCGESCGATYGATCGGTSIILRNSLWQTSAQT